MAMPPFTYPDWRYYYSWFGEMPPDSEPSDRDLKSAVVERLQTHAHTKKEEIDVAVEDGVVTLDGEVSTRLAKRSAGDDAWDTPGVVDVRNQLRPRKPTVESD